MTEAQPWDPATAAAWPGDPHARFHFNAAVAEAIWPAVSASQPGRWIGVYGSGTVALAETLPRLLAQIPFVEREDAVMLPPAADGSPPSRPESRDGRSCRAG